MDSEHLFATYKWLLLLIFASLLIGAGLALSGKLGEAITVLLTNVVTGSYAIMHNPSNKAVTIDNKDSDPVPVKGNE